MSLEELMFLITPQRRINPTTGQAIPKRGPRGYEADFSVPGQADPYAALLKRAGEIASRGATTAGETVARPFTPNTWNGKQVINPNGTFGPKIYEYSPFQKIGAGAAGTGALVAGGVALDDAMHPKSAAASAPVTVPDRLPPEYGDIYERIGIQGEPGYTTPNAAKVFAESNMAAKPLGAPAARAPSLQDRQAAARSYIEGKQLPMRRPEEGGLASLFNRPLSTRELYQQSQDNPDDAGAYMRAERQFSKMHPDERSFDLTKLNDQGMASGGAAKPHKDAALHKALDIISHMLGRH